MLDAFPLPVLLGSAAGGALLRWPEGARVPAEVELVARGVAVGFRRVLRFAAPLRPVAELADAENFPLRTGLLDHRGPGGEGVRAGGGLSGEWSVPGETTPFVAREDGGHDPLEWDLTRAARLDAVRPAAGERYRLSLDLAQHRCAAGLALEWQAADGAVIRCDRTWRAEGPGGGVDPLDYGTLVLDAVAPAGVDAVRALLLQGPPVEAPDAFLFFRRPSLILGERTGVALPGTDPAALGDPDRLGLVPLGDTLLLHGGPLAVRLAAGELPLPPLDAPAPPPPWLLLADGGALVAEGPEDSADPDRPPLVAVDGVIRGTLAVRRNGRRRGALLLGRDLLDGAGHWVELIGASVGETIAAGPVRFPAALTPPDVLRHEAGTDSPADLPFAAERYRALVATLARPGAADRLGDVMEAHERLLRGPDTHHRDPRPLQLPAANDPRFSVIVPAHDRYDLTRHCLAALLLTCTGLAAEVILVDDGSADATGGAEADWPGLRVVHHDRPQGFVRACNAGAAAARGEFLVFLNNDTEPTGRWLEELHLPFLAFARTGATGAKLVHPDGRLQDAGGIVWSNGAPWNLGEGGNPADPAHDYTRAADYLSGAALMVARGAWERVGGFASDFEPAYYEDTDLAFRLRSAGYATLHAPKATVVHLGGGSHGTDPAGEAPKRFQRLHAARFADRHRPAFRDHGPEGRDPSREKDRAAVGRALVLDYQVPRFDRDAGSAAIANEMRMLQHLGWKVALAPGNMAHLGPYTETLQRAGVESLHAPFHASQAAVVAARGGEFDLFYLHRWATAAALVPLIRTHAPSARVLVNCADLHFLRRMRAARAAGSTADFAMAEAARDEEVAALSLADAVLTYSDVERGVLEALMGPAAPVHLIPFAAPDPPLPVPLAGRRDLGFLGSFDHPPNREAVRFFLSEVWPTLRERFPALRFRVAGTGFDAFEPPWPDDRVDVIGRVPDALAFLGGCRVAVAPLRSGAGVKGKVLDALASGTPGVLSPLAAEGLDLAGSPAARIARTPDDWVAAVSTLQASDEEWHAAAAACAGQARRRSFAAALPRFRDMLTAYGLPVDDPDRPPAARVPAPLLSYGDLLRAARGV